MAIWIRSFGEQIHKYASVYPGKKLQLDYERTQEKVLTDPKWLGFVIGQCISNALKYTKTGEIRIYLSESRPHTLVIEDTGAGISAEDLPRIFEKGFTGYMEERRPDPSGIGLYLSRKIMKRRGLWYFRGIIIREADHFLSEPWPPEGGGVLKE